MERSAWEWFSHRTYHHERFGDVEALLRAKDDAAVSVSVVLPTRNEAGTVGKIVRTIREEVVERRPLVDEILVIDADSTDGTPAAATTEGATVVQEHDILPNLEPAGGKGEALWKSLFASKGDLILFVDTDIQDFDARFVTGLLGPILTDPAVGYVKALYERPLRDKRRLHPTGGGRVTELVARPLINMFWPHLAAFVQPLSGEYAGRRSVLEQVPFFTGYGVELGLLVDIAERFGLDALAQVDLDRRVHRNQSIEELSRMAFGVTQAAMLRLSSSGKVTLNDEMCRSLNQFRKQGLEYLVEESMVEVVERPPAVTVPAYPGRAGR
jgi:glucosyl-3-phosphoglycerate synthase